MTGTSFFRVCGCFKAAEEWIPQRHAAVHDLLDQGVGLLECARRLGVSLNTVKRYARVAFADDLRRPPPYRRTMVAPYRGHPSRRLKQQPDVPVTLYLPLTSSIQVEDAEPKEGRAFAGTVSSAVTSTSTA